ASAFIVVVPAGCRRTAHVGAGALWCLFRPACRRRTDVKNMPPLSLPEREVHALMRAEHGDPFAVLGPHETRDGLLVRALLPGAQSVAVMHTRTGWPLALLSRQEGSDIFAGLVPAAEAL